MINLPYKHLLTVFFLMAYIPLFSQEKKGLKIFMYKDDKAVEDFGVANITTQEEGIFTDGYHVINASEGDELMIASSEFKNFNKLVITEDVVKGKIEIHIKDGIIQLEEVVLTSKKITPGTFTDYVPIIYTPAERRVATANKMYYKGDGLKLTIDPLINAISGRTKNLRKRLKAETNDLIVEFLEDNYKDYILNDLGVSRDQLGLFCYFVSDRNKGIHKIIQRRRVEFLLKRLYLDFVKDPAGE